MPPIESKSKEKPPTQQQNSQHKTENTREAKSAKQRKDYIATTSSETRNHTNRNKPIQIPLAIGNFNTKQHALTTTEGSTASSPSKLTRHAMSTSVRNQVKKMGGAMGKTKRTTNQKLKNLFSTAMGKSAKHSTRTKTVEKPSTMRENSEPKN